MKKAFFSFGVFLFIFSFSCNKSSSPEPDPCGEKMVKQKTLSVNKAALIFDNTQWTDENILTALNGGERTFMIMLNQSDLCSQKLLDIGYNASTTKSTGASFAGDIVGKAEWGEGSSELIMLCEKADGNMKTDHQYNATITASLKPNYSNIKTTLTISFHTLGNTTLDTSYFRNRFKELNISITGSSVK